MEKIRINESPDWLHRKEPGLVGDRLQSERRRQARHFATSVCMLSLLIAVVFLESDCCLDDSIETTRRTCSDLRTIYVSWNCGSDS